MNEERRQGFISRMFSGNAEEEGTTNYSAEEIGVRAEQRTEPQGFTIERAADVIRNLPPEVPRPAAVRIVRGTLEAAGIDISDLVTSTRARESKINSEIDLSQNRIQELKDKTEEVIQSHELEIRKVREARDLGISEEERRISAVHSSLEDVERVRDFFGLSPGDYSTTTEPPGGEEDTQVIERPDEDDTEILRRPGPLSDEYFGESRDR